MHRLLLIILSVFIIVACSVSNKVDTELAEIEEIMNDHPDSALCRLQQIDTNSLNTDRREALYRLLYSQALDKNYIDIASDSIIAPAVKYFNGSDDEYHKLLALFYNGVICENAQKYPLAVCNYLKAYDIALKEKNYFWAGRSAGQLSDIFNDFYLRLEALKYAKISLDYFRKTDDKTFIDFGFFRLARMYNATENYDTSVIVSDMFLDSLKLRPNIENECSCYGFKAICAYDEDHYKDAIVNLEIMKDLDSSSISPLHRCIMGISYIKTGNMKKADSIAAVMKESPDTFYDAPFLSVLRRTEGDYENAFKYYKSHYLQMKEKITKLQLQNISDAIAEMRKSEIIEKKNQLKREEHKRNCYITFFTLLSVALLSLIIFFNRRNKNRIEQNVLMAENLRELLAIKEKEQDSYKERVVKSIIDSKVSTFDSLCKTYFENSANDKELAKTRISEQIDKLINELSTKSKTLKELETFADDYLGGIITSFKKDFPKIKREDYLVFLYSLLGFSIMSIAFIIGESNVQSVYSRKKRLKERITNSDAERREEYIKRMR